MTNQQIIDILISKGVNRLYHSAIFFYKYALMALPNSPFSLAMLNSSKSFSIRIYRTVLNLRQAALPSAQVI